MFRYLCLSMLCLMVANAQPLSCEEDSHCSVGYYCEIKSNLCRECVSCQDFKRVPPKLNTPDDICIKSIDTCGPCLEGFVNIHKADVKGKCVKPEFFDNGSRSHFAYVWLVALVFGILIMATFVYVIKHMDVFRVVAHYHPVPGSTLPDELSVMNESSASLPYILKYLLYLDKVKSRESFVISRS